MSLLFYNEYVLKAPIPENEIKRSEAVHRLALLDKNSNEIFDKLTREATTRLSVPISTLTIIDKDIEWYKSHVGIEKEGGARETSFCGHALLANDIFVVTDTLKDERFADNPMVKGEPFIRFYAGKSLYDYETKLPVGVFCIKDLKPRQMNVVDVSDLLDLADRAEKEINKK
jgi:GAF domain-containing protein